MKKTKVEIEHEATQLVVRHVLAKMLSPWGEDGRCELANSLGINCPSDRYGPPKPFEEWCEICKARYYLAELSKETK